MDDHENSKQQLYAASYDELLATSKILQENLAELASAPNADEYARYILQACEILINDALELATATAIYLAKESEANNSAEVNETSDDKDRPA